MARGEDGLRLLLCGDDPVGKRVPVLAADDADGVLGLAEVEASPHPGLVHEGLPHGDDADGRASGDRGHLHSHGRGHEHATLGIALLLAVITGLMTLGATCGGSLTYDYSFNVEELDGRAWEPSERGIYPTNKPMKRGHNLHQYDYRLIRVAVARSRTKRRSTCGLNPWS